MLDILLLYPFTNDIIPKAGGVLPSLGLGYLDAYLKKYGVKSEIVDCTGKGIFPKDIVNIIKNKSSKFVGISAMTPFVHRAVEMANYIKSVSLPPIVIMGGSHVNSLGKELLEEARSVDLVVKGEGEQTLLEVINKIDSVDSPGLENILGICYRKNGMVIENPPRELINDLDFIDFPTRQPENQKNYQLPLKWVLKKPFATMITSRGCVFSCAFCDVNKTFGRSVRYRSVQNIMAEIKYLVNIIGIRDIIFYDDTFTVNKRRAMVLCDQILREGLAISWGCYSRVDTIDYELAKTMKDAGCRMISFGVESGDDEMLIKMRKGINTKQALAAIKICNDLKIETSASFVLGFPGETQKTIRKTKKFVIKLNPLFATFFRFTPYPGTPYYNEYLKQEDLTRLSILEFRALGLQRVIKIAGISEKNLVKQINSFYFSFYLNPKKLLQHFFRILFNPVLIKKYFVNINMVFGGKSQLKV